MKKALIRLSLSIAILSAFLAALLYYTRSRPVIFSFSPDPTMVRPRNYCLLNPFRVDILPPPNATALWRGIPGLPPGRLSVLRRRLLACSPKGLPAPFVRFVSRRCGPDV